MYSTGFCFKSVIFVTFYLNISGVKDENDVLCNNSTKFNVNSFNKPKQRG